MDFKPDDKIVIMGMSCSGKTVFAKQFTDHHYYCFDSLFQWHTVETLGLSTEANMKHVSNFCNADRYVLDGWHLSDKKGKWLPEGSSVYVVYASYDHIIDQYRVPVRDREQHRHMFKKWYYEIDYPSLSSRYFLNEGQFTETSEEEFLIYVKRNR